MEMSGKNRTEKLFFFRQYLRIYPKMPNIACGVQKYFSDHDVDNCQGYSFLPFSTFGSPDTDARLLADNCILWLCHVI